MAEELDNLKEHKEISETLLYIQQERLKREHDLYSQSASITETLKEQYKLIKDKREHDNYILSLNKQITRSIAEQNSGLSDIKSLEREIEKNKHKILINTRILGKETLSLLEKEKLLTQEARTYEEELKGLEKTKKSIGDARLVGDEPFIEKIERDIDKYRDKLKEVNQQLRIPELLHLRNIELQKQANKEREHELGLLKQVQSEMGLTGATLEGISQIPGLGGFLTEGFDELKEEAFEAKKNIIGAQKSIKELQSEIQKLEEEGLDTSKSQIDNLNIQIKGLKDSLSLDKQRVGFWTLLGKQMALAGENLIKTLTDPAVVIGKIIHSFLEVNKQSVEFQRLTGTTADLWEANIHTSIISSTDYIRELSNLTRQFGVNAQFAFDQFNIIEMAEMTKLMGMSADQAGNLARLAQTSEQNLAQVNEQIVQAVNNYNRANNVGVNHRQILEDISKVSSVIQLSLEQNPTALARAAAEARKLGLELSALESIASSLLNFEQSISAQLEAELLTGQRINLERARSYALLNDMEGLSREISTNQELISSFAGSNRIQQEAIANSLGLSREQMGEMVMQSKLYGSLTEKQRAQAMGMTVEDLKRLEAQQSINQSIQKMAEVLAGPLEYLAQMVSHKGVMYTTLIAITGLITGKFIAGIVSSIAKLKISLLTLKAINAEKTKGITLDKIQTIQEGKKAAAATSTAIAKGWASAMSGPQALLTGGLAGLAIGAIITAAIMSSIKRADDLISSGGYGKRILSAPEGTYALNDKDTVIAGTNLFEKEKSPQPQSIDINLINEIKDLNVPLSLEGWKDKIQESISLNIESLTVPFNPSKWTQEIQDNIGLNIESLVVPFDLSKWTQKIQDSLSLNIESLVVPFDLSKWTQKIQDSLSLNIEPILISISLAKYKPLIEESIKLDIQELEAKIDLDKWVKQIQDSIVLDIKKIHVEKEVQEKMFEQETKPILDDNTLQPTYEKFITEEKILREEPINTPHSVDLTPLIEEVQGLRRENQEFKILLNKVLNREGDIYLDGNKVGIALTTGTSNYSLQ